MRDLHSRLQDILDAIIQIEVEQVKGKAAFDSNPLIQVWMVRMKAGIPLSSTKARRRYSVRLSWAMEQRPLSRERWRWK